MRTGLIIAIISLLLSWTNMQAHERTTRKKLRSAAGVATTERPVTTAAYDTITGIDKTAVGLSGYDKPLRSRNETLFVTNHTTDTILAITIRINYMDMRKRQLHSAERTVRTTIPPNSTRQITMRSWDRQQSFYYIRSAKPRSGVATPYDVSCEPVSIVVSASDKTDRKNQTP